MNRDINKDGYYIGNELKWSTEDILIRATDLDINLTEKQAESVLIATFKDNEYIMEMIGEVICGVINHMIETGALETKPPMCANCGEREVEVEGQPCSKECRDGYIADWLTEK